jgi:hypothetical protein
MKVRSSTYALLLLCLAGIIAVSTYKPSQAESAPVLQARMLSPKYRNAIYPTMGDPEVIKIRVRIGLSQGELDQTSIDVALSRNAIVIKTWQIAGISENDVIELPVSDVAFEYTRSGPYVIDDNPYEFTLELKKEGILLDTAALELNRYPPPPEGVNEVRIDDDGNVVINGEPAFLIGAYISPMNSETYNILNNWGFNAVRSTESQNYYNLWFFANIAKIYSTPSDIPWMRSRIQAYREAPKIVAWYIADEPNTAGEIPASTLKLIYQMAKEEDPYHPAGWVSSVRGLGGNSYSISEYTDTGDFFGPDVYPCYPDWTYIRHVTTNFEYLRDPSLGVSAFEHIDIPTWGVPQMWGSGDWRWPEPHEEKNMVYQYVANGAKSLFPYKYTGSNIPLWEYWANTLIPELKSIRQAIFASMKSGTSLPNDLFPQLEVSIQASDPNEFVWSYRQTEGKEYLFLVNTTNKWNKPLGSKIPGPEDSIISVEISFNEPGSDVLEALIRDANMPQFYSLVDNQLTLTLDGVNETSTGVLVLARDRVLSQREDINRDGYVDALDLRISVDVILGFETDPSIMERADVNEDGVIDALDIQMIVNRMTQ